MLYNLAVEVEFEVAEWWRRVWSCCAVEESLANGLGCTDIGLGGPVTRNSVRTYMCLRQSNVTVRRVGSPEEKRA
jgi:hypothetical protein